MLIGPEQVAVVTGSAQGLGRGLAAALVQRGVSVVLADRKREALDETAVELSAFGGEVLAVAVDVREPAALEELAARTVDRFGRVDLVVNNAGIVSSVMPIWETDPHEWERVLAVNVLGVVHGIRAFVPHLIRAGAGHVLNIASRAGLTVEPFAGPYCASKHAVVAISETLRAELNDMGLPIGVTVACPGFVRTPMTRPMLLQAAADEAGHAPDVPALERLRAAAKTAAAEAIDPEEAAARIIDAVERDRFYALTHRDDGSMRRRAERVLEAVDERM